MERLAKISLIISLVGILLLTYISSLNEPPIKKISEITNKNLNQKLKILGEIKDIRNYEGFAVISIEENNSKIQGLIDSTNLTITPLKKYYFIGRVSEHNHTLQINIEKISS